MISLGTVPAGSTIYIPFATYAAATGASATCTGLAVTDIEIYKNGSITQRASDAGYTLLDTDGIDFDGITGLHGFSVDLNDNTDAGFFAVGSWYWVVVSAITVDSQTVTFLAAVFRIGPAEVIAGYPVVDAGAISGDATAADNCELMFDGTGYAGGTARLKVDVDTIKTQSVTLAGGVTIPAATLASTTNITAASGVTLTATTGLGNQTANITGNLSGSVGSVTGAVGSVTGAVGSVTGNVGGNVTGSVGSVVGAVGSVTGNVGGNVTGSVGSVAGAVGSVTAGVTVTTNNDKTGYSLATAPPTAAQVSTQVASDLASAHGAGAWTTATGFSTHSAADVVTALGTGSTLTALATATALGDVPTNAELATAITGLLTTQMTESYNADGTAPTLAQALFVIMQRLTEFAINSTTITVKKLDGSTTALTLMLDDATTPTSSTRAT